MFAAYPGHGRHEGIDSNKKSAGGPAGWGMKPIIFTIELGSNERGVSGDLEASSWMTSRSI